MDPIAREVLSATPPVDSSVDAIGSPAMMLTAPPWGADPPMKVESTNLTAARLVPSFDDVELV